MAEITTEILDHIVGFTSDDDDKVISFLVDRNGNDGVTLTRADTLEACKERTEALLKSLA